MKRFILLLFAILTCCHVFGLAPIDVFESTLKVSGLGEEVLYYGFAAGDQLIFNFEEINGKELKEIEISELPYSSKFMDYKISKIENKVLTITNQGIYKFRFSNTALGGRICKIKIQRVPSTEKTQNFNTSVYWKNVFDTTYTIIKERYLVKKEYKSQRLLKEKHYINSALNLTGRTRISISIILPSNTVKWYYVFSASRNEKEIERTHSTTNLLAEISNLIDKTGLLDFGIQALTQPPGGDICDVFLLTRENAALFEQNNEFRYFGDYSRENLSSGIVQVGNTGHTNLYLGIKNPATTDGIHISVEAVAITLNEEWGVRDVKQPNVVSRKEAYLIN